MVLLSIAAVLAGLVLIAGFFGFDLLDGFQVHAAFFRGLLGVLVLGHGLIGFWWFLKIKRGS